MTAPDPRTVVERHLVPPPPAIPADPPMLLAASAWRSTVRPARRRALWPGVATLLVVLALVTKGVGG